MVRCKLNLGVLLWVLSSAVALYAVDSDGYYIYKPDWSGGSGAWADGSRWYDGVAPSENCKVKIGNAAIAVVSDDDMEIVEKLSEIRLHTENAVIQFNISGDYHLSCPVYHYGKIVKNGTGALYLEKAGIKAYETTHGIVVNEGALYLPKLAAASKDDHYVGALFVNKPGRLYLFDGAPTYAAGISGDGAVSNLCTVTTSEAYRRLKIYGGSKDAPYEFTGSLGNNISYMNYGGHQYFRRDNDTSSRTVRLYSGTFGLSAMSQAKGDSISKASEFHIRGLGTAENRLKYIGNGDCELTHQIKIYNDAKNFILDSGVGCLNVNGSFYASEHAEQMTRVTLDGERDGRGVFNVSISEDDAYATYLIKKGSGTWRMAANDNQLNGVIEVQSGTLEFTSLAERGELCALGRQNILHENYVGEKVNKAVDYAVRLGDGDMGIAVDTGTLAYVGDNAASCSTRPIVVDGSGRLSNEGAGSLDWSGISPIGDGNATIVFAGSAQDSIARSVGDAAGRISVVKEGAGCWTLKGNMDISGSIESKGGTLRVDNNKKFKWYRFNIRDTWKDVCDSNGVTGTDNTVLLRGFALIAADNLSSNIMYAATYNPAANGKPQLLAPGEVCYAAFANMPVLSDRNLDKLFTHNVFQAQASSAKPDINPADESTWVRIAMRVPEDAAQVVKYDIRAGTDGSATANEALPKVPFCREVRSWSIDGSSDGEIWETLVSEERDVSNMTPFSNKHWYSSKSTANMSGMSLPRDEYTSETKNIEPAAIGVSGGGALSFEEMVETAALKLYANESGTISNVRFLSGGTIDVSGAGDVRGRLPVVFEDVVGLDNVVSYALTVNGEKTFSKITLHGGTLSIVPPGLSVHIR